jgi:hypothetical protein
MRRLSFVLTFIVLTGLYSCEPPVTFTEPQPVHTDNLSKFPKRLKGQYLSLADKSILVITDKLIQRVHDFDYKVHKSQLDSNLRLVGDTIVNATTNEKQYVKRELDSLIYHVYFVDTLFTLNYDNVLRKFKGYYFINTRYDKESWEVKKINISRGQLTISSISTKLDLENLKEITESANDTISPYQFTTTKRQFRKFVRNDGFSDIEIFARQKKYSL